MVLVGALELSPNVSSHISSCAAKEEEPFSGNKTTHTTPNQPIITGSVVHLGLLLTSEHMSINTLNTWRAVHVLYVYLYTFF